MKIEAIGLEKLPGSTPDDRAYRYIVGYSPVDAGEWWSDFVMKEIAFDKDSAVSVAKRLQERLKRGARLLPELDSTRMWRVCIVDIHQPGKLFSDE